MNRKEQLLSRVVEYLNSQNWHYSFDENDNSIIRFNMNINSKLKSCRVNVFVRDDYIRTYTVSPLNASSDVYTNVVEYITRANYGLNVGSFEFDYSDGEIRYHSYLSCNGFIPPDKDIERYIDIGFLMFNKYGDGLVKNLMGFGNPENDIKEAEK